MEQLLMQETWSVEDAMALICEESVQGSAGNVECPIIGQQVDSAFAIPNMGTVVAKPEHPQSLQSLELMKVSSPS